jgi:hypothetical protein
MKWAHHTSAKTLQSRAKCCDYSFNKQFCVLTAGSIHPSGWWVAGIIREQQSDILLLRPVPWDDWFSPQKSWFTGPCAVMPTDRLFGRRSQKGPNKKLSGRTILRPNFGRFWTKRAEKGPNFNKIVSLLLSSLFLGKCPRNIVILPLTQIKIVFFLSPNSFKEENY